MMILTAALFLAPQTITPFQGVCYWEDWWPQGPSFSFVAAGDFGADPMPDVVLLESNQLTLLGNLGERFGPQDFGTTTTTAFCVLPPGPGDSNDRVLASDAGGLTLYQWDEIDEEFDAYALSGTSSYASALELQAFTWPQGPIGAALRESSGTAFSCVQVTGGATPSASLQGSFSGVPSPKDWVVVQWDAQDADPEIAIHCGTGVDEGLKVCRLNGAVVPNATVLEQDETPRLARLPGASQDRLLWSCFNDTFQQEEVHILYPGSTEDPVPVALDVKDIIVGDYDGDSSPDALCVASYTRSAVLLYGGDWQQPGGTVDESRGTSFDLDCQPSESFETPPLTIADIDLDGDGDIVMASNDFVSEIGVMRGDVVSERVEFFPDLGTAELGVPEVGDTMALELTVTHVQGQQLRALSGAGTNTSTGYEAIVYRQDQFEGPIDPDAYDIGYASEASPTIQLSWDEDGAPSPSVWPILLRRVRRQSGTTTHIGSPIVYYYMPDGSTFNSTPTANPWNITPIALGGGNDPGGGLHARPTLKVWTGQP